MKKTQTKSFDSDTVDEQQMSFDLPTILALKHKSKVLGVVLWIPF
jgi:hypothetical protein